MTEVLRAGVTVKGSKLVLMLEVFSSPSHMQFLRQVLLCIVTWIAT